MSEYSEGLGLPLTLGVHNISVPFSLFAQVEICQSIYRMGSLTDPNDPNSPIEVGHNIYILAFQLAHYKKELKEALDKARKHGDAIEYYAKRTAQIEVKRRGVHCVCVCVGMGCVEGGCVCECTDLIKVLRQKS